MMKEEVLNHHDCGGDRVSSIEMATSLVVEKI
jgi:hypothetical protein